jgi:hypothetical protein
VLTGEETFYGSLVLSTLAAIDRPLDTA